METFKGAIARRLTLSTVTLALLALTMAISSILSVQFTDQLLSQVAARADVAALSARIRSESLSLTDLTRRYMLVSPDERPDLQSRMFDQQVLLNSMIDHLWDLTLSSAEYEQVDQIRFKLRAFIDQANRTIAAFDSEKAYGPATNRELIVLTQDRQEPLLRAMLDFEQFEFDLTQKARAQAQSVIRTTIGLLTGTVIIVLILSLLTIRQVVTRIVTPLVTLRAGVEGFRLGQFNRPVPVSNKDEIGELAAAFNTMATELHHSRLQLEGYARTLEQQVAERTREVEQRATQVTTGAEIARVATTLLDPDQLVVQIIELIQKRFEFYYVGLFLLDVDGAFAVLQHGTGRAGREMKERGYRLQVGGQSMVGWVCANKRARIALDVGDDPVRFANPLLPDTHSEVAFPLRVGERIIGALDAQSTHEAAFDESNIAALQGMVDQVAIALENARLYTATRRQNEYLAALHETTLGLMSRLDLNDLLEALVTRAGQLVGTPHGYIYLIEPLDPAPSQAGSVVLERKVGVGVFSRQIGARLQPGEGLAGRVWQSGQPLIIDNYDAWQGRSSSFEYGAIRAAAGAPLKSGAQVVGVIGIAYGAESDRAFGHGEVELLTRFAELASIALENARLFRASQTDRARFATLYEAGRLLAGAVTTEDVARAALSMTSYVGAQHSNLILLDLADHPMLYSTVPERRQMTPEQVKAFIQHVTTSGMLGWILEHRQPILVTDTTQDLRWLTMPDRSGQDPIRSSISVPLFNPDGDIIGTLGYTHPQPHAFGLDEQQLAEALADQVSIALENARLNEVARRRAEEAETLRQAGAVVAATLRQDEAIERILRELARVVPHDSASVQLLRDGYLEIVGGRGWLNLQGVIGLRFPVPDNNPNSVVVLERRPLILAEASAAYAVFREGIHSHIRSWLGVPLVVQDRVIGILAFDSAHPNYFTPNHSRLAAAFADQVAIAIENARLYQEMRREKRYFESLVLNNPAAIVVINDLGQIVSWNPAAQRLFGYTQAEAIGQNIDHLVATEATRAEAEAYSQQAIRGELVHAITQRGRKDGTTVDVELFALPVIVEGQEIGSVAIYHDITELQRARQEAEAANQAKSSFLAMMSHEIRTPMNGVIGMASLLLDTPLSAEQRDYAETIRASGEALLTIINDILDFSKIEAGRMELENQPFDLRECVESALDLVAARAAEKGLEMAYFIDPQVPTTIVGDVTRLRQIMLNLLGNAIKFTEQGEVVVSVNTIDRKQLPAENEQSEIILAPLPTIHFSVRDTGIGIPADRMDRLFQSFSQVDASTTRKYGGTGLGLAISQRLCELMGGAMWVESPSQPPSGDGLGGPGSTFHFTIQAEAAPSQARVYLRRSPPELSGRHVLIVDDNATNRRILTLQIQAWNMLPRSTEFPHEALEWICRGDPFDVAFLDMHMPHMDGLMLAAGIRRYRDARTLPLVMLSSLGRREFGADAVDFAAYLVKPIKPSQLYDALVEIFAKEAPSGLPERSRASAPQLDTQMAERLPLRILIAEDNTVNQKLALQILRKMGYRADIAANGLETLEALERQPYDVILMDVQMPEMDGLEATRRIRAAPPQAGERRPRIIAMTANAMQGDREICLAAGMDDYISKPIRIEELVMALSQCCPSEKLSPLTDQAPSFVLAIDWNVLDELRNLQEEGEADFVQEMINLYLHETPPLLAAMREAVTRGHADELKHSAHTLKGNSNSLGAKHMGALSQELEKLGRGGTVDGAAPLLAELEREFERVRLAFESR